MVDYSQGGHCVEQSELMEPDTCQSKTSPGPDPIQDILLLLGEITGPAVLSLWEAAARPNMSHAYSQLCGNPRRPDSIFVLQSRAITVHIPLIVFSLLSQHAEQKEIMATIYMNKHIYCCYMCDSVLQTTLAGKSWEEVLAQKLNL